MSLSRVVKFLRKSLIIFILTPMCALPVYSANMDPALKKDFPEITKRLTSNQPADFVIVLDKSGSMKPFWGPAKQALSEFLKAIPDGDYVSLIVFGNDSTYLTTPSPINQVTRAHLVSEVERIQSPTDQKTDIGKAFEKVLHELNRPGGNMLKFIFFLTDFNLDAPTQSPYYGKRDPSHRVWQELVERRKREQKDNIMQVYALILPLEKTVGKDIALGRELFRELEEIRVNQVTLLSWFERRKAELARDKLRAFVRDDILKEPFIIERLNVKRGFLSKEGMIHAILKPESKRVITTQTLGNLVGKLSFANDETTGVEIVPLELKDVSIDSAKTISIPIATVKYLNMPFISSEVTASTTVVIEGKLNLAPGNEIGRLGLPTMPSFTVTTTLPVKFCLGYASLTFIIVFLILALLVISAAYFFRTQYVDGRITIVGIGEYQIRSAEKKRWVNIGNVESGQGFEVPRADWLLMLRGFRPFEEGIKQRGIYVKMGTTSNAAMSFRDKKVALTNLNWVRLHRGTTVETGRHRIAFN